MENNNKRSKARKGKRSFRKMKKTPVEEENVNEVIEEEEEKEPESMDDLIDIEAEDEDFKKEMIECISTQINLPENEVYDEYDKFHEIYPDGEISKEKFLSEHEVSVLL